jgi:hypothetical protein
MASRSDKLTLALMTAIAVGLFAVMIAELMHGESKSKAAPSGAQVTPASTAPSATDGSSSRPAVKPAPVVPRSRGRAGYLNG